MGNACVGHLPWVWEKGLPQAPGQHLVLCLALYLLPSHSLKLWRFISVIFCLPDSNLSFKGSLLYTRS